MNVRPFLAKITQRLFRRPKSKARRAASLGLSAVAYLGLLTFPGVLFAHYHEQGAFRVWSDEPIDPSISQVLTSAEHRLIKSPLYDRAMVHRLYICNEPFRMKLLAGGGSKAFGVTYLLRNNTVLNRAEITADRIFRDTPEQNQRPLSSVVAHERVHALIVSRYGAVTDYRLPRWKKEGYCEYVAGNPSFDIAEGKRLIREGRDNSTPSFLYLQYYLMVKYLIDVEHVSVDELITRNFQEAEILAKMRKAVDQL